MDKPRNTTRQQQQYYQQSIISFNADTSIIQLREQYNQASFFEIISKSRSETTYSSFLRWLFGDSAINLGENSPILLLLDILVKNDTQNLIDDGFKKSILSRTISIVSIKAQVEKSVATITSKANELDKFNKEIKKLIEKKCQDKIDLYIELTLKDNKLICIYLENKVDSSEGEGKGSKGIGNAKYDQLTQTERYYSATKLKDPSNVSQVYIYLTPNGAERPKDPNFIHITYQSIVDGIIDPLLASSSLSIRSRFFLEEFKNQLIFPSLDDTSTHQSIANGSTQAGLFKKIWEKYEVLFIHSILASAADDSTFWILDNTWYNYQPRIEYATLLINEGNTKASEYLSNGKWRAHKRFESLQKLDSENHLTFISPTSFFEQNESIKALLSSFWQHNRRFLIALIGGLDEEKRVHILGLLSEINKRDYSKYTLTYSSTTERGLSKRGVVSKAFELLVNNEGIESFPSEDSAGRTLYYRKDVFDKLFNEEKITKDTYTNRYSLIKCNDIEYYLCNQWGTSDNWDEFLKTLVNKGFTVRPE